MRTCFRHLLIVLLFLSSLPVVAQNEWARDTVYFYDTWQQMLDREPASMLVSPIIEAETPYAIDIYTTTNDYSLYKHMAATLGDSIWLMSSEYLKRFNNEGDVGKLDRNVFIPVFFNEKVAFLTYVGYGDNLSLLDILIGGGSRDEEEFINVMDYYYIDFMHHRVNKVTPEVLSELLEDYHDLQVRYEGMKDYKKRSIIEYFFLLFVDRASQDIMRPYILDLVEK